VIFARRAAVKRHTAAATPIRSLSFTTKAPAPPPAAQSRRKEKVERREIALRLSPAVYFLLSCLLGVFVSWW
jgi:hypothetical protein